MKGKTSLTIILALTTVLLLSGSVAAHEYVGWGEIRPALLDGDGSEFVVDDNYSVNFPGNTEFEKVLSAANWVAYHMKYVPDLDPPGDVWTSSDQQFDEIINNDGIGTGDCEDFAILLCALMRFNVGVPADRVWVQGGIITVPGQEQRPPIFGHAYVVYKAERGGIFYIEPQVGGIPYRGSFASFLHWSQHPPSMTGESAMLRFNDEWVKGGGFWLAGPRK